MEENLENKLHLLFINYAKDLPRKILQISQDWQALSEYFNLDQFKAVYRQVHELASTSSTFGYLELGRIACELENYITIFLENKALKNEVEKTISSLINSLKEKLEQSPPQRSFLSTSTIKPTENYTICILEKDKSFVRELCNSLKQVGYSPQFTTDFNDLEIMISQFHPFLLLIDTDYLTEDNKNSLLAIMRKQKEFIQLFCFVSNEEVLPRLSAIRAGCSAVFQKPVNILYLVHTIKERNSLTMEMPFRILIIEDSEWLGEYYSLILKQAGMIAEFITNPLEVLNKLENFHPDLVLMDIDNSECTGIELAAILHQENKYTNLPIIFLSTQSQPVSRNYAEGDYYLTKPVMPLYLISVIRSRLQRANSTNYSLYTDSLTGLLNHTSFLKRLELELAYAKLKKIPMSLIMLDIDHLNKINEKYGHQFGDSVIKKLTSLLTLRLRSQDIIGRYGGEELSIVLSGTGTEQSKKILNELREQFSRQHFYTESNFFATFSAGVTQITPDSNAQILIKEVEEALYKAKHRGRNQIVVY